MTRGFAFGRSARPRHLPRCTCATTNPIIAWPASTFGTDGARMVLLALSGPLHTIEAWCEMLGKPWPDAGQSLLNELQASRERFALIAGELEAADSLVDRLATDLSLTVVHLGAALADQSTPPTITNVEAAAGSASILADLDLLLWPTLGIPLLPFLRMLARRRPVIAVWPGEISRGRVRYSASGRPDHYDERLTDVVVLQPRNRRFPDEVPYEIERIAQ